MSQVHTQNPLLVGRAHVDLCRRTAAACRRVPSPQDRTALMRQA